MTKKIPFAFKSQARAVSAGFTRMLAKIAERGRNQYISQENVQKYHHGETSVAHYASDPENATTMMTISHQTELSLDSVLAGDFSMFEKNLAGLAKGFQDSFVRNLYQTVGDGAERVGNSVSAKGRPHAEVFLEALKKIEFGVDREGNVSVPDFHVSPEVYSELIASPEAQSEEIQKEFDRVKEEKSKAALEREAERKAKFKK